MENKIGYVPFIVIGTMYNVFHEELFTTIEECENYVSENYPEYLPYYGIDKVQDDDGWFEKIETIKEYTQCYLEDFE